MAGPGPMCPEVHRGSERRGPGGRVGGAMLLDLSPQARGHRWPDPGESWGSSWATGLEPSVYNW